MPPGGLLGAPTAGWAGSAGVQGLRALLAARAVLNRLEIGGWTIKPLILFV
jgi:hypothetical protein